MIGRLAVVIWWLGALVLVMTAGMAIDEGEPRIAFGGLATAAALWGLCFILSGAFWKPPPVGVKR